jgi:hypothetical protein
MKSKKVTRKAFDKKIQEAQDFIEPLIDMVFCFTSEIDETERIDQLISQWAVMACAIKMSHPELQLIDLMPQNLEETMNRINFGQESMMAIMGHHTEIESYI